MSALERFHQVAMLGMLLSSYLAVVAAQVLDLPTAVLAGLALTARILMAARLVPMPRVSESLATVAAFLYLGFYPIDYYFISRDFLGATIHLVFFLASVLLLRARGNRDYALLEIVAFLEILAAAAVSQSGTFLVFLAMFFLFATAAATARNMIKQGAASGHSTPTLGLRRSLTRLTLGQFAAMLVLGVGFFFFLPRTARAALEHWMPNRFHVSGFSNSVTLGQIGEIRMNSTPVMHARLYSPVPARDLKWRGATLASFDGKRWFNPPGRNGGGVLKVEGNLALLVAAPQQGRVGRRVFYDVRTRPASSDILFFLGTPELLQIDVDQIEQLPGSGFRLSAPVDQVRYLARSVLGEQPKPGTPPDPSVPPLGESERDLYLQLPRLDPRVTTLAASLAPSEAPGARALAIEHYLSTQLRYTTELPTEAPRDPIADFLFRRREGHCEYFASAMALMLRSQGIPSRIVTGYQSGVFNPLTEWYLIRAADAHSWVEAYLPGHGWQSFDPTPSAAAAPSTLFSKLALYADAMEVFWQEWVVGYDQERQIALAGRVGRSRRWQGWRWSGWEGRARLAWEQIDWRAIAIWGTGAIGLLGFLWSLPKLSRQWRSRRQKQRALSGQAQASDATLLYLHMSELLKRQGMERPTWMTPVEFAATQAVRERAPLAEGVTDAYNDLRFGNHQESAGKLAELLSSLEVGLRAKPR